MEEDFGEWQENDRLFQIRDYQKRPDAAVGVGLRAHCRRRRLSADLHWHGRARRPPRLCGEACRRLRRRSARLRRGSSGSFARATVPRLSRAGAPRTWWSPPRANNSMRLARNSRAILLRTLLRRTLSTTCAMRRSSICAAFAPWRWRNYGLPRQTTRWNCFWRRRGRASWRWDGSCSARAAAARSPA